MTPEQRVGLIAAARKSYPGSDIQCTIRYGVAYTWTHAGVVFRLTKHTGYGGPLYGLAARLGDSEAHITGDDLADLYNKVDAYEDARRAVQRGSNEATVLAHLGIPTTPPT
jgi:hypothetical protein